MEVTWPQLFRLVDSRVSLVPSGHHVCRFLVWAGDYVKRLSYLPFNELNT